MTEDPENLILVYLRRLDSKVDRLTEDMHDVKERLTSLELGVAGIRRELATLAETDARLQASFDRMRERIDRIERRLDLTDQPGS